MNTNDVKMVKVKNKGGLSGRVIFRLKLFPLFSNPAEAGVRDGQGALIWWVVKQGGLSERIAFAK